MLNHKITKKMETKIEKRIANLCLPKSSENLDVTDFFGQINIEGKNVTILYNRPKDRWTIIISYRIWEFNGTLPQIFSMNEIATALVHTQF